MAREATHGWVALGGGDGSKALKKGLANDRSNREVKKAASWKKICFIIKINMNNPYKYEYWTMVPLI